MTQSTLRPSTRLHGRALWLVRSLFWLLVGLIVIVGTASFLLYFTREGWQICNGSVIDCQVRLQYSAAQAADFARRGFPFENMLALRYAALLLSSLVALGTGLFIAVQRSDDWIALLMAFVLIQAGMVSNEGVTSSLPRALPAFAVPISLLNRLSIVPILFAFGLFPTGRPIPAWMRIGLPVMSLVTLILTSLPQPIPRWLELSSAFLLIVILGALLYSQILRYRRVSTYVERKQTKWAVMGFVLFLLTFMTGILLFSLDPFGDNQLLRAIVGTLCFTLLPGVFLSVFIGIAILRSKLWDIDIIIRRTLTYALVTALLVIVFFGSVILLQQLFSGIAGAGQNEIVTVLSTLAIAALFVPVRNRVQTEIDKRFNRKKYDSQRVLTDFANTLRDETDLEKLTGRLMEVVDETMQPKSVSVWLKNGARGK